jgi:hypothetical protein
MDEKPPEIAMSLDFLPQNVATELIRLTQKCLTSRSYGMEYRMDHGRDLMMLRSFIKDHGPATVVTAEGTVPFFDAVCGWLDYEPDEVRLRIARTQTWDMIREHLESTGSSVRMPIMDSHIDALRSLQQEHRGQAWAQFYENAVAERIPMTAKNIRAWAENYTALPVESETVTNEDEPGDINFEDDEEEPEVSQEDVPHGAKQATAADVTPASGPLTQAPGQGPLFEHPPKVKEAINTIVKACGGDDPERQREWRKILSDPLKIKFEDLLDWAKFDTHDIRRIASLATGDLHKGLRTAMRIIKGVIDSRTTLNFLFNKCQAEGGHLEHVHGPYKIVITYQKDNDYET